SPRRGPGAGRRLHPAPRFAIGAALLSAMVVAAMVAADRGVPMARMLPQHNGLTPPSPGAQPPDAGAAQNPRAPRPSPRAAATPPPPGPAQPPDAGAPEPPGTPLPPPGSAATPGRHPDEPASAGPAPVKVAQRGAPATGPAPEPSSRPVGSPTGGQAEPTPSPASPGPATPTPLKVTALDIAAFDGEAATIRVKTTGDAPALLTVRFSEGSSPRRLVSGPRRRIPLRGA